MRSTSIVQFYLTAIFLSFLVVTAVTLWVYKIKASSRSRRWFLITAGLNILVILTSFYAFVTSERLAVILYYLNTFGQVSIPLSWYLFASTYINDADETFNPVNSAISYVYGVFILGVLTNEFHNLFGTIQFVSEHSITYPTLEQTLLIPVFIVLGFGLILLTVVKLFVCFKNNKNRKTKYLTSLLIFGVLLLLIPFSITQFHLYQLPLAKFDHTVFGSLGFFIVIAITVTEFGFLEITPQTKKKLFKHVEEGIVIVDVDGTVTEVNDKALDCFPTLETNAPLSTVSNWPFGETIQPENIQSDTHTQVTIDGEERHFVFTISPVEQSGETLGYFCLFRDITELQRTKDSLKKRNQELQQFSHTIAHDLRNPLNVASGYTEIIESDIMQAQEKEQLAENEFEETLEYITKLNNSFTRMEDIIADVLTMVDGKTLDEDSLENCTLGGVAEAAWEQVETTEVTVTIEDNCYESQILADKSKLQTIFENLYRNSIEHGKATEITIGKTSSGFFVSDNGKGIDTDISDSLFDYGVSDSSSDGTGLGLSIIKTLANAHNWSVAVDTSYSNGAKFNFDIHADEEIPSSDSTS